MSCVIFVELRAPLKGCPMFTLSIQSGTSVHSLIRYDRDANPLVLPPALLHVVSEQVHELKSRSLAVDSLRQLALQSKELIH